MQEHPGNFCLWNPECWGLESGIQLKESGILLKIGFQNPSFIDKEYVIQYLQSGIHGAEFRIQACLGFSCIGQLSE